MSYSFARFSRRTAVRHFLENLESRVLLSVIPNDPQFANQYYLNKIDAPDAWTTTTGNATEVVAVLDTGVDVTGSDIAPNLWTNPNPNDNPAFPNDIHGWNFLDNNNDVSDNSVHGTSTASVIGAAGNNGIGIAGIGWNVKILPVEIGTLLGADSNTVAAGINYIIGLKKEGVNIVAINASYISFTPPGIAEINAINNAGKAGILYVAAAGNSSLNLDSLYPASFIPSNLIFVAATDENDNLASFSSYGAHTVAVGAPGVDIETTIPGDINVSLSGTSYAAPMVTGIAALLKAADPSATVAQLKAAILNSGDLDPALAGKTITGRRVNAAKALQYLLSGPVTPPPKVNQVPIGAVESTSAAIIGHAQDPDTPTKSIQVKLFLDNKLWKTVTANVSRPDLTATLGSPNHGFSVALSQLPKGVHRLDVYAVDSTTHASALIGSADVSGNFPPIGFVETLNSAEIAGYAFDAQSGAKPIQVRYTIDGGAPVFVTAGNPRPDLGSAFGSINHGFAIALPQLTAGNHTIAVDTVDPLSDQLVRLTSQIVTITASAGDTLPTAAFSTFSNTLIAGTVSDAAASAPLGLRIDVDGKIGKVFASTATADATNDTFAAPLKLSGGPHRVDVYAIDPMTNLAVLLKRDLVGYVPTTGTLTSLTAAAAIGTASSPTTKGGKSLIRVDIDGMIGTLVAVGANFGIALPPLTTGSHHVMVTLVDPVTLTATVLGDSSVAFA